MARTTEITSQRKTGIGHEVLGFKNACVISLREAPIAPKRRLQIAQGWIERETAKSKAPPHTVTAGHIEPAREPKTTIKDGQIPEHFSVVPLLLA